MSDLMNGYNLTRAWFDFKFENTSKCKHVHSDLYFYCIDLWNRLGNKKEFGLPTSITMENVGIRSYNTYKETLNDLVTFGFIKIVKKSINQHSATVVALSKIDKAKDKAKDKAHIEAEDKPPHTYTNKEQRTINNTLSDLEVFDVARKKFKGTVLGNKTEFNNFKKKHNDWQDVLPILELVIDNQIKDAEIRKQRGEFVPEWKNFKTWLNQRCWEQELKYVGKVQASEVKQELSQQEKIDKALEIHKNIFGV
jgi:hypothetical protein